MAFTLGTHRTFAYISRQDEMRSRDQYRIHIIERSETICRQSYTMPSWDIKAVESLDGVDWLCKSCVATLERREQAERDQELRQAKRAAKLATMPVQGSLW